MMHRISTKLLKCGNQGRIVSGNQDLLKYHSLHNNKSTQTLALFFPFFLAFSLHITIFAIQYIFLELVGRYMVVRMTKNHLSDTSVSDEIPENSTGYTTYGPCSTLPGLQ